MDEEALIPVDEKEEEWWRWQWGGFVEEVKKTSYLAFPMVLMTITQYMSRFVSIMMVGHLGELPLSGASIATSLTNVMGFSLLFGMSSGLETLCGQAYGAEQYQKLGAYTYAAIISLLAACTPISVLWIFLDKILIFTGQDPEISEEAGRYAVWLIPALFPYAIIQALTRYLQTQSLIIAMFLCSLVALIFQVPLCWVLVYRFELGTAGAAVSIGLSYWLNVILLGLYVMYSPACQRTRLAAYPMRDVLPTMKAFFKFAIPSAVMVCLEWWTFEIIVLLSGLLPNPQLETSVLSICLLIGSVHYFIPFSIGTAASIRVSNELGAGNPDGARMNVVVVVILAVAETTIAVIILLCFRGNLGFAFSNEKEVISYLDGLMPLLCILLLTDCVQSVLSGVVRGSGWQHVGAYINLGSFYVVGVPVAAVLGFALHFRGTGLWIGLNAGSAVQSALLSVLMGFTDWKKQASLARERTTHDGAIIAKI